MWHGGMLLGVTTALASAGAWYAADAGAHSYSHASIHVWNAGVRLAVFLTIAILLDRLREARDTARALALTDPLTGSANSRAFYVRLEHEIARTQRTRRAFALVYFDLDGFKLVNDTLGHPAGDRLLQSVAQRALRELRAIDMVARLGGDEFAVLLTDTDAAGTIRVLDKLRAALLDEMSCHDWPVTLSFGAATFHEPPAGPRQAIQLVDELMYGVKGRGKNGVAHTCVGEASPAAAVAAVSGH